MNRAFDHTAASITGYLTGEWRSTRRLVDHRAKSRYAFEGVATITRERFFEQGEVSTEGRSFPGTREYRLEPGFGVVRVHFPDGRPFVDIRAVPSQTLLHHCGNDLYSGRMVFLGPDNWVEQWRVSGPAKRYSSLTRFKRVVRT